MSQFDGNRTEGRRTEANRPEYDIDPPEPAQQLHNP